MDLLTLLRELALSQSELLEDAKAQLQAFGPCDHDVGICICENKSRIERGEKLREELSKRDWLFYMPRR
jgi:hypothetical protein